MTAASNSEARKRNAPSPGPVEIVAEALDPFAFANQQLWAMNDATAHAVAVVRALRVAGLIV